MSDDSTFGTSAYGGPGWSPRIRSLAQEVGSVWGHCGIDSEWRRLTAVVLHRPGPELAASSDPDAVQMLAPLDVDRAGAEHDALADAFRAEGVAVHLVVPPETPPPNQMFCADLMLATPQGVVLARPASTVRAGEERWLALRLAALGVPIVRSIAGTGVFEGADAAWLDPRTVVVGRGHRTNDAAITQIAQTLATDGVDCLVVDMPYGTMHLMGMLRIVDHDLAIAWPRRTPHALVIALRERGHEVAFLPEGTDREMNRAMNFVTLAPRRILLEAGYDRYQRFYEALGITCVTVEARELIKAAGGFGCLTGVLERERA
ncbi:MAG: amidinotransferase [Ectothiorhodospiraceae bacterium]|nr:amidinotransferase [Ectothiorhodospiraceae bacterium]